MPLETYNNKKTNVNHAQLPLAITTGSAHLSLYNKIIENFQDGSTSLVLFLAFQRAFETLDRGLLLTKLERMGFRGKFPELKLRI